MTPPLIGVYKITNNITGKYYIGYSKNINKRFYEHKKTLKNGKHQNIILQRSYDKYTLDAFTFETIHIFDNIEDAKNKELEYLQNLEIRSILYNINYNNSGGDVLSSHPDKEYIRKKISDSHKITISKMSEKERKTKWSKNGEKNGMFGKTHTDEVKEKLSRQHINNTYKNGYINGDETRTKISKYAKTRTQEKNPMYGKTLSDEAKKKISEKSKGRISKKIISVTIDDVCYISLTEASKLLNIPTCTILWRIKSENLKFSNYKYTDESSISHSLSTKISIDNVEYNSILEACNKLKFCKEYVTKRIKSDLEEDKEWKILDKPRDKRLTVGKKIEIKGVVYNSVKDASIQLQINEAVLAKILNAKEPIPVSPKRKVSIDNIIYDSITDASKQLNININTIVRRT